MKKNIVCVILTLAIIIGLLPSDLSVQAKGKTETWAIYWYLCGSDLESEDGSATSDLDEMGEADLPDNVTVVIQTGGAKEWQNDVIDAEKIERYEYSKEGLNQVDSQKKANMGDENTLESFLKFCNKNYKADHKILVFWNHGGGSVGGVCYDELYDNDSLSLSEISSALKNSGASKNPYDIIGFDSCLMATLDTATAIEPYAKYMLASEETESGIGWDYETFMNSFNKKNIKATELGKNICDSFYSACEETGEDPFTTLSLVDLSKIKRLNRSVDNFGEELLAAAAEDASIMSNIARDSKKVLNYGPNSKKAGYTNMVDLGDLAKKQAKNIPAASKKVQSDLKEAVVYQVKGKDKKNASGLSIYYPLDNNEDKVNIYKEFAASKSYRQFLSYVTSGDYPKDADKPSQVEEVASVDDYNGKYNLSLKDNYITLKINPKQLDSVASVNFSLEYYLDEDSNDTVTLGYDNDLHADWEKGIFKDNLRGVWGSINGHLCYMEISYEGDDYNEYYVPVNINGDPYYLDVIYDLEAEEYEIISIQEDYDQETGKASRSSYQPESGDVMETIFYLYEEGAEEAEEVVGEKFTLEEDLYFEECGLPDGEYLFRYSIEDLHGNFTDTEAVYFTQENEEIGNMEILTE